MHGMPTRILSELAIDVPPSRRRTPTLPTTPPSVMLESSGRRVHVHTLDSKDMGGVFNLQLISADFELSSSLRDPSVTGVPGALSEPSPQP